MDKIRIVGGAPLRGEIPISGAKNATLPLMAASLLTEKTLTLTNVPNLSDVQSLIHLLQLLGVQVHQAQEKLLLQASDILSTTAPYDHVRKMRASILVLGPLLARFRKAHVSLPGGCVIGTRPVDVHLSGLKALGAQIELDDGYIVASAPQGLTGASYTFPVVSVTGTENLMMAACLAKGETRLFNAAKEPEIKDLADCLIKMGATIEGAGTDIISIQGTDCLTGAAHRVLPDRIETGTYIMAAAMTRGSLLLKGTTLELLPTVTTLLEEAGVCLEEREEGVHVSTSQERLRPVHFTTHPYPGFATDLQAQMMALMTVADGPSLIVESVFENRFMHVPELCRMGADITVQGTAALVKGLPYLQGAPVMATDIRASVCLVLAALAAQGETVINRVYHLDRGYENLEDKLTACGAFIERIKEKAA